MDKEKCKNTINRFLEEVKTVTHTMIDGDHFGDSPVRLVREAIDYLDEKYEDLKQKEKNNETARP